MEEGRPPKYKTAEQLQIAIDSYWKWAEENKEPPMMTRLALHLGFASRQSLYDYGSKDEFAYTIKRAVTFIEMEAELSLIKGGGAAEIFRLKNFGWTDKQELEVKGKVNINPIEWAVDE